MTENTRRGYRYDWLKFSEFCRRINRESLPADPETIELYAVQVLQGHKVTTASRWVAAIASMHKAHGFPSPVTPAVRLLFRGAWRSRLETVRQVEPLSLANLRAIARALPDTPAGARDKAIVVIGFSSALRSCNVAALELADVEVCDRGLLIEVRREKTDQEGKGRLIGLPRAKHPETCPVLCLESWLRYRGCEEPGPLFTRLDNQKSRARILPLRPQRICQIVQRAVALVGLDPLKFGSHSMRAGFITEAGLAGVSEWVISTQTGHRDMETLRRYFRRQNVWRSNAAEMIDL